MKFWCWLFGHKWAMVDVIFHDEYNAVEFFDCRRCGHKITSVTKKISRCPKCKGSGWVPYDDIGRSWPCPACNLSGGIAERE